MKLYIKNICAAILLACLSVSCDLNTSPTNALETGAVYKDMKNIESVFRGSWRYLFNSSMSYAAVGIGSVMLNDDFAGSDAVRTPSYGFAGSYQLNNGFGRDIYNNLLWHLTYKPINNLNAIIKYVDDVEGGEQEKALIKGKAYATRGYLYFLLASHYSFAIDKDPNAVCVPIYTEPSDHGIATTGNAAASVSEVYAQALLDLKTALTLIPETYSKGNDPTQQYVPDYVVLMGLLARVNLYARNWQDAHDYASKVLAVSDYLMTEEEYKSGFNDCKNREWLWAYSGTVDDSTPCYLFHFKDTTTPGSFYTSLNTDPNFKEMFDDGDYRKDLFNWGLTTYGTVAMLNSKFKFRDITNKLADIVMMRISEMYLIKAEASAHLPGGEDVARSTLQKLRDARMKEGGVAAEVTESGDELIRQIWIERRKELWGEGFALTDIIRNQQSVERKEYNATITLRGQTINVQGHTALSFPDNSAFVPNSKYYLFRILEQEELQNDNLYSVYPQLPFYQ